jgi:uncharacterized repeat protein (TIGR01451 family)
MKLFAFFRRASRSRSRPASPRFRPQLEALEDRCLPSASIISGYVYLDQNNNGLFDPGEKPIANAPIQLLNGQGQVIASTTTDSQGYYQFDHDPTIPIQPKTVQYTLTFGPSQVTAIQTGSLPQFDPSLGQLQSVTISNSGQFTINTAVENTSTSSGSTITVSATGDMKLTGPGSVLIDTPFTQTIGSFQASPFDGTLDFGGTSGKTFDPVILNESGSLTLTNPNDLAPFIGTGNVNFTETLSANSQLQSLYAYVLKGDARGQATVTVTYTYLPTPSLPPGTYIIRQPSEPTYTIGNTTYSYLDGRESQNGVVIPNSVGTDQITVTLPPGGSSTNNNFGELLPASLSGYVYYDANDNGSKDAGESGIAGVTVTLTGTNDLGPVNLTTTTGADGSYQFSNLRPGTYTITETQPAGYLEGKNSVGSLGGALSGDAFSSIGVGVGAQGTNYNFGEVKSASLSGFVYYDANNNGQRDPGEPGIAGVTLTLTGTDDQGHTVQASTQTASDGSYQFSNLRPGTYQVTETQPAGYAQGVTHAGSAGGTVSGDTISNIVLGPNAAGTDYDFGETLAADLSISKLVQPPTTTPSGLVTYTLIVSNLGPSNAQNVTVTDALPAGEVLVSWIAPGWTENTQNGQLVFNRGSLAAGASKTITLTVQAPPTPGTYPNVATVTSQTPDNNPGNNQSTAVLTVVSPPVVPNNPPPIPVPPPPPPASPPPAPAPPPSKMSKALLLSSSDFWVQLLGG